MARYIPVLRWKRGERVGLSRVSAAGRRDVFPMFVIGTEQFKGKKETKKSTAIPTPEKLALDIEAEWGTSPFYLEAMSGIGSTRSVRFSPERSHVAGGQNGPDRRCDWAAPDEEAELRGSGGAVGHQRAAFSCAYEERGAEGILTAGAGAPRAGGRGGRDRNG